MGEISKLQAPECHLDSSRWRASKARGIIPCVVLLLFYLTMLFYLGADVKDGGPTLKQNWVNVSCLLGMYIGMHGCAVILHANT